MAGDPRGQNHNASVSNFTMLKNEIQVGNESGEFLFPDEDSIRVMGHDAMTKKFVSTLNSQVKE